MFGGQTDPTFLEYYEQSMTGRLDGFERLLKKQKYLAGDVRPFHLFFLGLGQEINGICIGNIRRRHLLPLVRPYDDRDRL